MIIEEKLGTGLQLLGAVEDISCTAELDQQVALINDTRRQRGGHMVRTAADNGNT